MKTILDYADLVKEQHALNTIIAPVETDLTSASKAYAVGQKFVYDGVLYQAKTAIAQGAALVLNTNYEAADDVSSEIQTLTNNVDVLIENGAVNKLPNNAVTQTINGITFTVNTDPSSEEYGAVTITTKSGGSTALTQLILFEGVANWHNMVLSGAPSTASATTYDLSAYDTQTNRENSCRPNDVVLTNITDGHTIRVFIRVRSGQVITEPITFKPMIADADYTGDYVPYAMTNRELTEIKSIPITLNSDYFDNNATAECFKLGRLVWLQVSGTTIAQIPSGNIYLTTSSNIPNAKVGAGIIGFAWNPTSGILGQLRISSNAINFPFNTAIPSGTQFKITLMYMTEE